MTDGGKIGASRARGCYPLPYSDPTSGTARRLDCGAAVDGDLRGAGVGPRACDRAAGAERPRHSPGPLPEHDRAGGRAGSEVEIGQIAQDVPPQKPVEEKKESTFPVSGRSVLLFDQSMTTQTAQLNTSPQLSFVPLYELVALVPSAV